MAERTKSASGWAVFNHCVTGPVELGALGEPDRGYSNNSGSVRAISSHSGWKLNHPAAWNAGVLLRVRGVLVADLDRIAGRHRHQLGLARPLHGDEPEGCFVDGLAHGEQAVVLMDGRLAVGELRRKLLAGFDVEDDRAALLGDDVVVLVEDARVLGERGERDAERAERLAVRRVRVGGGDHIGAGGVHGGVDHERRSVDRLGAVDDLTVVVDEDQIALADVAEAHPERVHPEHVGILGIADGDVAGDAFAEAELAEDAQCAGEVGLAVVALVLDVVERRDAVEPDGLGGELDPVDRAG